MSNRREVDPRPTRRPVVPWPGAYPAASRRDLENARWWNLARGKTYVQLPDQPVRAVGPMLTSGQVQFRPLIVVCGQCGTKVGDVWITDSDWQGRPFTWADCWWITERAARGPLLISRFSMILDRETEGEMVEAECPSHGVVSIGARTLLEWITPALDRLATATSPTGERAEKPTKMKANPVGS